MQYNTKIFNEMIDITDTLDQLKHSHDLNKNHENMNALYTLLTYLEIHNYNFEDHESPLNLEMIQMIQNQTQTIDYHSNLVINLQNTLIANGYESTDLDKILNESHEDLESNNIYVINKNSLLYQALIQWYQNHDTLMIKLNAIEDQQYLYFIGGIGYDAIDKTLLNGTGSGATTTKFMNMLNCDVK